MTRPSPCPGISAVRDYKHTNMSAVHQKQLVCVNPGSLNNYIIVRVVTFISLTI